MRLSGPDSGGRCPSIRAISRGRRPSCGLRPTAEPCRTPHAGASDGSGGTDLDAAFSADDQSVYTPTIVRTLLGSMPYDQATLKCNHAGQGRVLVAAMDPGGIVDGLWEQPSPARQRGRRGGTRSGLGQAVVWAAGRIPARRSAADPVVHLPGWMSGLCRPDRARRIWD
jgi:hypothetical protein